jgi:RHS repeat-associated protein
MAGISSKALNGATENKKKFNGGNELQSGEFIDGSGLELYDAVNRGYDAQIGRFWQVDELAEGNWEWTPYNFAVNNPILRNDPLGLKDSTVNGEHVNTVPPLAAVTVTGYTPQSKHNIYWQLVSSNTSFSQVKSENLREWLYRQDGIQKFKDRTHKLQREQEIAALQIALWVMPAGHFTKLRYLKYAAQLFKLKRGLHYTAGAVDLTSQAITNKGEFAKINLLSTASSTLIGNPLLSSVPGSFARFSIGQGLELRSVYNPDVYKSIFLNTLGNISGAKLGEEFRLGSTLPEGQFIGETLGTTGASIIDEISKIAENK